MANQKAIRFEVTGKIDLETILNKLISEKKYIIEVIATKTNQYGILVEGVIIYKENFSLFNRNRSNLT